MFLCITFLALLCLIFGLALSLPTQLQVCKEGFLGANELYTKYGMGSCANAINGVNRTGSWYPNTTSAYCVKGSNNFFDK